MQPHRKTFYSHLVKESHMEKYDIYLEAVTLGVITNPRFLPSAIASIMTDKGVDREEAERLIYLKIQEYLAVYGKIYKKEE